MVTTESPAPLDEKLTTLAHAERLARAQILVKNYTLAAAALVFVPLPFVDELALMGFQVKMVHDLARRYDVPFKPNAVRALIAALLSGLTGGILTSGLYRLARAVPVFRALGAGGFAVSSASVTYAVGSVFIKHFEDNGTLLNVDAEWFKKMFKHELSKQAADSAEPQAESPADSATVQVSSDQP